MPNMPAPTIRMAMYAPPRLRSSTTRSGSNGCAARPCQYPKAMSSSTPAARNPHVDGVDQLCVAALENP
jgi:hypothetical protein